MKPSCLDTKYMVPKSQRYAGEVINGHTLVGPRGAPGHGPPLYWDYRCRSCGAVSAIATASIKNLAKNNGCKLCVSNRRKQHEVSKKTS